MAIITLTTDFGARDGYVGAMKGVLTRLAREPGADVIVDLAHDMLHIRGFSLDGLAGWRVTRPCGA